MARIPRRLAGIGAADLPDAAAFDAYVGPARELTVDPVRGLARLHDGSTPGGIDIVSSGGGVSLPAGGDQGEVLVKASSDDGDAEWVPSFSRTAGFLYGLTLSNNVTDANNDIDIASGSCRSIENDADIILASALTKRLDAVWAAGNNAGGLDTGAKANGTGYHAFAIRNPTSGAVDVIFSTSATNPSMPSGFTQKRRLGAFLTDDSGNIRPFVQVGGWFMLKTAINLSVTWGNLGGNSPSLKSAAVPTGVKLMAKILAATTSSSAGYVAVTDPDLGAPTLNQMAAYYQLANSLSGMRVDVWTNASGQVYAGHSGANATTNNIFLQGWYDTRDTSV
jgi:hypothetical protein